MNIEKEYRYVPGRGYVSNIDGEEVVYDKDELPELIERLKKSKEQKPKKNISFKEFIYKNLDKYPDLAYIFDKK